MRTFDGNKVRYEKPEINEVAKHLTVAMQAYHFAAAVADANGASYVAEDARALAAEVAGILFALDHATRVTVRTSVLL